MTSRAPRAAPPNAILVWADAHRIYAELPTLPSAGPCIMAFDRSAGGLSKVINLIYGHADVSGDPQLFRPARSKIGTATQQDSAEAVLRQRGLIKSR